MGICCLGNRPAEKFIGSWTDDKHVSLDIDENGRIQYRKEVSIDLFDWKSLFERESSRLNIVIKV